METMKGMYRCLIGDQQNMKVDCDCSKFIQSEELNFLLPERTVNLKAVSK